MKNPAFTFFADDVLAWEPIVWLTDAQLGQAFKLITYACKNGSSLPADHPLLKTVDPNVIDLCTAREGDRFAVLKPCDLPKLMLGRQSYLAARRDAAAKGGRRSAVVRSRKYGTAQPGGSDGHAPEA